MNDKISGFAYLLEEKLVILLFDDGCVLISYALHKKGNL